GTIYGNSSRGFPAAYSQSGLTVGHTKIAFSHFDVFILVAVLVLMTGTLVLFRATSPGLRTRASAFAGEISRLLGVRVGLLLTLGWALAGVAGSLSGLLVAPTSSFGPYFMDLVLVYAFTAAVLGGLESPVGALIGGLITGLSISYVGGYLGSGLQPLGALVLLMVALMARPEGIFARPPARRGGDDPAGLVGVLAGPRPLAGAPPAAHPTAGAAPRPRALWCRHPVCGHLLAEPVQRLRGRRDRPLRHRSGGPQSSDRVERPDLSRPRGLHGRRCVQRRPPHDPHPSQFPHRVGGGYRSGRASGPRDRHPGHSIERSVPGRSDPAPRTCSSTHRRQMDHDLRW